MKVSLGTGEFLVLSDLHIGHQASAIRDVSALAPLMKPGRTILFNGDTFEMRRATDRTKAVQIVADLNALLLESKTGSVFISGNHDPTVSDISFVEGDGVLITHGDALFHNVAPWSLNEKHYSRAHAREIAKLTEAERSDLASRLAALRRATTSYDISHPTVKPGLAGALVHLLETTWPPWRPLSILKCWAEIPHRAETFARTYRPDASTLIIGHSHFAGTWMKNGLRVINTGAAMTGFRPRAVHFENGRMQIKRLVWNKNTLELGPTLAAFDLPVREPSIPDLHEIQALSGR